MGKFLSIALFSILLIQSCQENPTTPSTNSELLSFADSIFQSSVDEGFISGAAVIVQQAGQTLVDKSYGYASLELEVPMPLHASFEIGSVTKQFTAAAILKLEEMGKLSLDDDFTEYLNFDTKGRTVSINQLLDHTSGIPSYTEIPAFWEMSIQSYPRDTLLRMVEKEDFLFEPGEALIYNNTAFFVLGLIIEELSDTTYEAFLQEHIFDPLEMNDTYYCSNSKVVKNKAYGYGYSPDGLSQKAYLDHTWPYAAGSLCSTTKDLMKWLKGIHKDGFGGEDMYKKLITPRTLNDGTPVKYAKGIANMVDHGHPSIRHGGGINGFLSETRYFPESDLFIICLVSTTGPRGGGFFANELTWQILEKKEYPKADLDIDLEVLAGRYTGQVRGRILNIDVTPISDGLSWINVGSENPDTLNHYIGNNTWMDGNQVITVKADEIRIDQGSGYYILKKQ